MEDTSSGVTDGPLEGKAGRRAGRSPGEYPRAGRRGRMGKAGRTAGRARGRAWRQTGARTEWTGCKTGRGKWADWRAGNRLLLWNGEPNQGARSQDVAWRAKQRGEPLYLCSHSSHVLNTCLTKPPLQPQIPVHPRTLQIKQPNTQNSTRTQKQRHARVATHNPSSTTPYPSLLIARLNT